MEHNHSHSPQAYTCLMHPEVAKPAPGKCPKCGMNLVPVQNGKTVSDDQAHHQSHEPNAHAAHDKHAGHQTADFLKRFWRCLILTLPVLLLSQMIQHWFGFHLAFNGSQYLLLLFSSIIYLYGGLPFLKGMVREIRDKAIGMMTLVAVAISTTAAAVHGLLIRNRTTFENARKLTTIIFDKTGTLTKGSHEVQKIIPVNTHYSEDELLQYAASVQQNSEHHIAHGIINKLKDRNLSLWKVNDFNYMQGIGVSGEVIGKIVLSVGPNYFHTKKWRCLQFRNRSTRTWKQLAF